MQNCGYREIARRSGFMMVAGSLAELAVGTEITRPPHRTVLARFMHTALTLSNERQNERLAKGAGFAVWGDNHQRASPSAPTCIGPSGSADVGCGARAG